MRLFAKQESGIRSVADLKGKTMGVSDMAAPDKNFFSIMAAKQGLDPNQDIEWRQFPADLLGVALQKGEVQAISLGDPLGWVIRERDKLYEVANNLSGEYAAPRLLRAGRARRACARRPRRRRSAHAGAAGGAGLRGGQSRRGRGAVRAILAGAAAQLAAMLRSHTHQPPPDGRRPQAGDRCLRGRAEARRRDAPEDQHGALRRQGLRRCRCSPHERDHRSPDDGRATLRTPADALGDRRPRRGGMAGRVRADGDVA